MTLTVDDALAALADFRRRSDAIRTLVSAGPSCAAKVRPLLDSPNSAVVWSAIRVLGDLQDKDSAKKLQELARHPDFTSAASDALQKMGLELAPDFEHSTATSGVPGEDKIYTDDELVDLAVGNRRGVEIHKTNDGFRIGVHTSSGMQDVLVKFPKDLDGDALVTVFADLGVPANPDFFEKILRLNARLPDGAVGIERIGNADHFVMTDTHLRATFDPPELAKSIFGIARYATRITQRIQAPGA